jgi:hypothetical protein
MGVPTGPSSSPIVANQERAIRDVQSGAAEFKYDDDQLVALVHEEIQRSQQDWQTKVAAQRETAIKYYYGEPFGNERAGFSRHVSMETFEAVEDVKTKILNAFTSGRAIFEFLEEMKGDADGAKLATDYVHQVFWRENDGYNIIKDCLHDGLVEKQCVTRPYVHTETKVTPEKFHGVPVQQVNVAASNPEVREVIIEDIQEQMGVVQTPQGPMQIPQQVASGTIIYEKKVRRIRVDVFEPESVFLAVNATDPRHADSIVLRYEKTRSQLVAEGFPAEVVDTITADNAGNTWNYGKYARQSFDDTYTWDRREGEGERSLLEVYEAFIDIDMDADGFSETWKLTVAGNELLDKELVAGRNFQFWSPYRVAHKAIGLSVADITIDMQRSISGIVRGVLDNVYLTNTSTKIADLDLIKNPRDLIDNPIGAVINASDPQAVVPLAQPQLNPATFEAMGLMKGQVAGRVGLQKIDQRQAISHQNSEDMVANLMAQGEERISEMARSFAECLLKPLLCEIYKLGVEAGMVVGVATDSGFEKLNPYNWLPERYSMEIKTAITQKDRLNQAQQRMMLYQTLGQDQQLAPLFGVEEKYALITDVFEDLGVARPTYLKNPQSPEGQQALQQAAQQAQQQMQMEMQKQSEPVKVAMAEVQRKAVKDQGDLKLKGEQQQFEALQAGNEFRLDKADFEWDKEHDQRELEVEWYKARKPTSTAGK